MGVYSAATPGVSGSDNATTRLDLDNELQPDALLWLETGGTSTISADGYIEGTPELIAEIATSSAAIDLGAKKNAYRRNRVQEYLVWQTFENRFSWFQLQAEGFVPIAPDAAGYYSQSHLCRAVASRTRFVRRQNDGCAEYAANGLTFPRTPSVCAKPGPAGRSWIGRSPSVSIRAEPAETQTEPFPVTLRPFPYALLKGI